ncbi:uncharacterized protein LOC123453161 [Hordeum vulgare subsp. vulgare]|uniref:Fungal lipase-type domain-containing protein n=1 Tax=Hordeum vulgare subsp. vulgare TaxID=112509 RepID=A0A8I6YEA5_HORVV|nr:uncharacterized protein LOC123453161 [Hordeum vulgare subsp. vulgare]
MPAAVAAAAAAAASGAALLAYLLITTCRPPGGEGPAAEESEAPLLSSRPEDGEEPWPHSPPVSCCEAAAVAARTARRAWELTVGRWGLHGLAFGIKRHMKRQGNLQHEYSGTDCLQLKGHDAHIEVAYLLEHLKLCMFYSKNRFSEFLKFGGYSQEDVLIHKSRARLMQPSFVLVRDQKAKCFLLFIRGAISPKERLTAASSVEVPFHHIVLNEGQIDNVILGYAHCGMLAAARWIANLAMPPLRNAVREFTDYQIKVIGHSMGAGIGAILTYILREHYDFTSCTCLAFGPAACMTWELAESGKDFITSLVNRDDVVPALSKVAMESLRSEVMVSSKLDDLQDQDHLSLFGKISQRIAFAKSHMLSISHSTGKTADPNSSISEPLLKEAVEIGQPEENVLKIDCIHESYFVANPEYDLSAVSVDASEERVIVVNNDADVSIDSAVGSAVSASQGDLESNTTLDTEQASSTTKEEASQNLNGGGKEKQKESPSAPALRQLFPPGRIIHMVAQSSPDPNPGEGTSSKETISIYETPRDLYGRIRLAPNMIDEHYMPSYISTMESLLEQLQSDNIVSTASDDL